MMHLKQKYIKTSRNIIIVFPELMTYDEFKHLNPVSAGFISINSKRIKDGDMWYPETDCACYGESISLGLKSDEQVDTKLAKTQILGHINY